MICLICNHRKASFGFRTCEQCSERLWHTLSKLVDAYTELCLPEAAVPGGVSVANTRNSRTARTAGNAASGATPGLPPGDPVGTLSVGARGSQRPSRRTPPGSRSPANDDVIVLTDPRTAGSIPGVLMHWADLVAHGAGELGTPRTMHRAVALLRKHWGHVRKQEWVAGFEAEILATLRRAEVVLGTAPDRQRPVGHCSVVRRITGIGPTLVEDPPCGGPLWPRYGKVRCGQCGTTIESETLAGMKAALEEAQRNAEVDRVTTADAAFQFGAKPVTVRSWLARGGIERGEDGRFSLSELKRYLDKRETGTGLALL